MSYLFLILWGGEFYIEPCTTKLWRGHFINCTPTFLHTQLHSQFNISTPRPVQLPTDAQTEPDNDNWDLFLKRGYPLP